MKKSNFNNQSINRKFKNKLEFSLINDNSDFVFVIMEKYGKIRYLNRKGKDVVNCKLDSLVDFNWYNQFISKEKSEEIKSQIFNNDNSKTLQQIEFDDMLSINGKEKKIHWQIFSVENNINISNEFVCLGYNFIESNKEEKIQQVILKILHASNLETNLNDFFKLIHSFVCELMPADNFYIALIEKESNLISFPYFVDQVDKTAPQKKIGKGLTDLVLINGKSFLINKEKDDELIRNGEVELLGSPAKIWLGIPLKIQDNTIGALVVQDYENENTFGEREQQILEVISFAISRAIERKLVEEEKNELIKKLKELNKSKDKLISLISHDLRSPFNSLLGFSEILINEYNTLSDEEINEYLKVIYESSKNLYGMTNNLLQFSKYQMGNFEFKPAVLNLNEVVNKSLNLIKGNAVKKRINLSIDINPELKVFADEDMLRSIIQNLISNAIKFTDVDGEVKLYYSHKYIESETVEIIIQDNGVGLSNDDLEKINNNSIFSTPGTEREYGTGLGLLLVKEFVSKNNGTFIISSNLKQGTKVCFTLPKSK